MKKTSNFLKWFSYTFYLSVIINLFSAFYPYILRRTAVSADAFANSNLNAFVADFFPWAFGVSSSIAVIMLISAGYLYVTSAGNVESINKAKELIVGTLTGLAFLMMAGLIATSLKS